MKRYVICDGAEILSYGTGPDRNIDAIRDRLPDGHELHEVQEGFVGALSDATHQWDAATQQVVEK